MKAIMVMFDSLNRHMLPPYGCDWVHAPNFERLAKRSITFTNSYIGSMPCMPARRELHTGRYNFLHRSWGPLEPFDDSMPEILQKHGVYTHLVTDHQHYFEDGGGTYHNRYSSWEFVRGQEGDFWKGRVEPPETPAQSSFNEDHNPRMWVQDWINRSYMPQPEDQPQHQVFTLGLDFIRTNATANRWFLQIETFDPHEPFFTHQKYKDLYPHRYEGPHFDWPPYAQVREPAEFVEHVRYEYAALVSMCDEQLGRVIDVMDELDLWADTMLIVCTDHGFLLGEHDWWAKLKMPWYNLLANTPLFIWDPRSKMEGETRESLVQFIDLPATLLEYFAVPRPKDMQGQPLKETIENDRPVRDAALFGVHGGHVNCTDGHYVYMRAPEQADNKPLHEYTLMTTHLRTRFNPEELQTAGLAPPFSFTKGCPVLKIEARPWVDPRPFGTLLFDVLKDQKQNQPLSRPDIEARMLQFLIHLMHANDAPKEQYERLSILQLYASFLQALEAAKEAEA
ncbi:MAG: sulfatase [Deinococcota bacterium]|jgi:arylsulfatase A-like enzyme|nr:sulfatase [Deinococcota bacterium]